MHSSPPPCVLHVLHISSLTILIILVFGEEHKLWRASLYNFISKLLLSNTINVLPLRSDTNFTPIQNYSKIRVLGSFIFTSFDSRREDKRFWTPNLYHAKKKKKKKKIDKISVRTSGPVLDNLWHILHVLPVQNHSSTRKSRPPLPSQYFLSPIVSYKQC
jgi:hypothetical protein